MKFLFDENLSPVHAAAARAMGHDAVAAMEVGLGGVDDPVIRSVAVEAGRILVTLDGDFGNILRYTPSGTPGVIRLRLHPPTEEAIAGAFQRVLDRLGQEDLTGKLAVVDKHKIRIRGGR